ncbi:MAG: hypothetical protein GX442_06010 [Candidatus Riflebacteria bacterium]|nr:hypothetical protein [Candidatus Riflebacteria bacterium]
MSLQKILLAPDSSEPALRVFHFALDLGGKFQSDIIFTAGAGRFIAPRHRRL